MAIHVFYDNSNIWGGAQKLRSESEEEVPWVALRISYTHIFNLLEQGRHAHTKVLGGSVPPSCEELWEFARSRHYETNLLKRVEKDDGSIGEQGVDELLHLKIANTLIDYPKSDILVVATGDGRMSEFGTGFLAQVHRAIKLGWRVEIWSWTGVCSRKYITLQKANADQVKLIPIDSHYAAVTFVKPGHYYRMVDGNREDFDLIGRRSTALGALDPNLYFA
ncbi:MAG: NYN domain-containing protein [Acidobacteriaceae bacterium]